MVAARVFRMGWYGMGIKAPRDGIWLAEYFLVMDRWSYTVGVDADSTTCSTSPISVNISLRVGGNSFP